MTSFGFASAFAFAAGMALLGTAALGLRIKRQERALAWPFLAYFAAALGLAEIAATAIAEDSAAGLLPFARLMLSAAGWILLIEFGRRALGGRYQTLKKPWLHAVLLAAAAIKFALAGVSGLEMVCSYGFAPLSGLVAAVALAQQARAGRNVGWGLPLMSTAIAFFAIGFALSVAALQAFAAWGLLAGIWRKHRDESPFPAQASSFVRWRAPAAFAVLTVLGCSLLALRPQTEQTALLVVQTGVAAETSDTASTAILLEHTDIDSRRLARERADAQRYKQGLSILIVFAVVAAIWVGLSRLQRRL